MIQVRAGEPAQNEELVRRALMSNGDGLGMTQSGKEVGMTPANKDMKMVEEQHRVSLDRSTGGGLGLSIAGGIGSTPYKNDDTVSFLLVLVYYRSPVTSSTV